MSCKITPLILWIWSLKSLLHERKVIIRSLNIYFCLGSYATSYETSILTSCPSSIAILGIVWELGMCISYFDATRISGS